MSKGPYVICERHGTEVVKGLKRMVRAQMPKNGKQRKESGCPHCKREARENAQIS